MNKDLINNDKIKKIIKDQIEKIKDKLQLETDENLITERALKTLNFMIKNPLYVSAFFDGEGNVNSYPGKSSGREKINFECEIKISQHEQDIHILAAIHAFFFLKSMGVKNIDYLTLNDSSIKKQLIGYLKLNQKKNSFNYKFYSTK